MEVVLGALPSLIPKLGELLADEYSLQKQVKGGIRFLQSELESMQGALEKISGTPADQLDNQDKIWANDVRDLSYDIEDSVDTFMVRCKGRKPANQPKIRRKIATEIRDIRARVEEVSRRRDRNKIDAIVAKPATTAVDPRLLAQYKKATEIIGIERARDELIKIITEENEVSMQQGKIVSIVGFGGLGKTTLANTETLDERQLIDELRVFLQDKRRIFADDNCPHEELYEVSDKILKKCAGVPLAIITIASLLASKQKTKMVWYDVYNSVGTGLEKDLDVSTMRKVLSLSYYDLPSHLRTCLLYLSVFPEDYKISKNRLIFMWIAEGFIQDGKHESLFEVGESYFSDLINRSMIQPVDDSSHGFITEHCRVHDMILDLLCSLSNEEKFVTIFNGVDHLAPPKVRRLSLQSCKADHGPPGDSMNMQHVRSIVAFPSAYHLMPALRRFKVLRVLDLQDCDLSGRDLKYICYLIHLRYLGLNATEIDLLPEEIGSLQSLQTLDVTSTKIPRLPLAVYQLRRLICLRLDMSIIVPNGIGSLTSLEELSDFHIDSSTNIIEELGHLTELRELQMVYHTKHEGTLVKSLLCKLQKIQNLDIYVTGNCNLDGWVAPLHIRKLRLLGCWFSILPDWMNPSHLANLSALSIRVREIQQKDLDILGMLPALRSLGLKVDHENICNIGRVISIGACSFPCLKEYVLWGYSGLVTFQHGSMPWLTSLWLEFTVQEAAKITYTETVLGLGLGYLASLQKVFIQIRSRGSIRDGAVEEVEAALRHVAEVHPNRPTLTIYHT
ncbi:hypothetical protein HU200_053963 [Digitaria exilis]|uniref:Uncharacterized protein n=1 Tax=Digitaria exilis TaxID=1010633 RepID=A0A835AID6_9POAL|nr:hypothetical protein HU200_053963 [Digitaria exilis]